jgi:hypothetical protein
MTIEPGSSRFLRGKARWVGSSLLFKLFSDGAAPYPIAQGGMANSEQLRGFRHAHITTMNGDYAVASLIAVLFFPRRPPDVSRLIIAVPVGIAIKRVLRRWSRPHVRVEVLELLPALANSNSSSSILLE